MKTLFVFCVAISMTLAGKDEDWKCIQDNLKIVGDQTPVLKPWLYDNQNRLLELFNSYEECKNGFILFRPICMGSVTLSAIGFRQLLDSTIPIEHAQKMIDVIGILEKCLDISLD